MQVAGSIPEAPDRPNPRALAAKAQRFLEQGRYGAAKLLIRALRPAGADTLLVADLEARLLLAQGQASEALALLDAELDQQASSAAGHLVRAETRLVAGDVVGAALDAADALILAPSDTNAKALFGRLLLRLDRASDAAVCLHEALRAHPRDEAMRLDLAAALSASGNAEGSGSVLTAGLELNPGSPELRAAVLSRLVLGGDLEAAVTMVMSTRREFELDAREYALLGEALIGLGRLREAADAYGVALKLNPEDPCLRLRHLAAVERCNADPATVVPGLGSLQHEEVTPAYGLTAAECAT